MEYSQVSSATVLPLPHVTALEGASYKYESVGGSHHLKKSKGGKKSAKKYNSSCKMGGKKSSKKGGKSRKNRK